MLDKDAAILVSNVAGADGADTVMLWVTGDDESDPVSVTTSVTV